MKGTTQLGWFTSLSDQALDQGGCGYVLKKI
jgi:hypothetical protein